MSDTTSGILDLPAVPVICSLLLGIPLLVWFFRRESGESKKGPTRIVKEEESAEKKQHDSAQTDGAPLGKQENVSGSESYDHTASVESRRTELPETCGRVQSTTGSEHDGDLSEGEQAIIPRTPTKGTIPEQKKGSWLKSLEDDLLNDDDFCDFEDEDEEEEEEEEAARFPKEEAKFIDDVDSPPVRHNGYIEDRLEDFSDHNKMRAPTRAPPSVKLGTKQLGPDLLDAVVLDNGSYSIKAGVAGDFSPTANIRNVIGRMRGNYNELYTSDDDKYIGDDAIVSQGRLTFDYPMHDGSVKNWRDLEAVWDHVTRSELGKSLGDRPVIVTDTTAMPREQRERHLQVLFEAFDVPAVFLVKQAAMALHAQGKSTGLVVSSGHGVTEVVPVYEGHCIEHASRKLLFSGKHVTDQLGRLLQFERGYTFTSSSEMEILRKIKQQMAFVATDYDAVIRENEALRSEPTEFTMPDGNPISIGNERFKCTEPLFRPEETGVHEQGLHELILQAIDSCDTDLRPQLWNNILVYGGNTKLRGFVPRLRSELKGCSGGETFHLDAPSDRENLAWIGASILSADPDFSDCWITMEEYAEGGGKVVHRKCF
ncbi:PREDICTED: actin-3-like isoform X1 [Branchiostoma belcheri]|uniref:Actin-3-like isoform X1 n=1 Tax=Branchiostoma belcheri TaxID=7741 RepID=A0A6P4Z0J8_BRABE|nr:PREDICTED: actin-3-like isoform X1 [Branchiostoma belcheri]